MSARKLLSGFALLSGATAITQVIGFVALAIAARRLGPEHLGTASFAIALAVYFAIPANFGLTILGMRDIAAEPDRRREVIAEVLALRAMLGVASAALLIAMAPMLAADPETRRLIPIAALVLVAEVVTGEWVLMGLSRPGPVALARLLGQSIYAVLVLFALGDGESGARLFIILSALSVLITACISLAATLRHVGMPALRGSLASARRRIVGSAPFGWGSIMLQVYLGAGTVLLGYLSTAASVGQYAVAQKIPAALLAQVGLWASTLYAHAARLQRTQPEELREHVDHVVGLSLLVALPIAVGGSLCGRDLIVRLFGEDYHAAGVPFALLMSALAVAVVNVHFGAVLGAVGDERRYAVNIAIGSVVCIGSGLALTSWLGTAGPAIGVIAAELAILLLMGRRYIIVVGRVRVDRRQLAGTIAATGVMAATLVLFREIEVLVQIALGGLAYAIAAAVLVLRHHPLRRASATDPLTP